MPPATAPLTGTTASRSSGGSGESDSSPENISGHDSASAAPPDDGESSMVSRREQAAAAAGRAPLAAGKGRRRGHQHPSGSGRGRRSPPPRPPTAQGPGAAAHLQAEGGTQAGRRVQRGPERRRDPAQVRVRSGRGAPGSAGSPPAPAEPSSAPAGASEGSPGSGWGWSAARQGWARGRRRQGPPPLTGSRRRRLRGSERRLPQPEGRARPGFCRPGVGLLLRNAQAGPLTLRPPLRPLLVLRLALL